MEPIGYPETSVRNCHYSLGNYPGGRSSVLGYWPLKMEPMGCPETSVRSYHYSLLNNTEERNYQLLHGGSLKFHNNEIGLRNMWQGTVVECRLLGYNRTDGLNTVGHSSLVLYVESNWNMMANGET